MGRPDGKVVKELPNYRRFMPYFLRHKYESLFYWQYDFKAEPGLEFVEKVSREYGVKATFFHLFTHCLLKTMVKYPGINRFAKGGRIYQRNGIWFSFSVKKERSLKSKVSVVKKEFKPDFDFLDTIKTARKEIKETREGKKDEGDKEAKGYLFFPGFLIRIGYHIYKFMDEHGLFSKRYIEKEVLCSSALINNVGAFGADPAYHHLYEVGTITQFFVLGSIKEMVIAENGKPVVRKVCPVMATVDERGEDAFYYFTAFEYFKKLIENPEMLLESSGKKG